MHEDCDMLEFHRLLQLWLEQTITDGDATRLWAMVASHKRCADALAAAARMEVLLEDCLALQAGESAATGWLLHLAEPAMPQKKQVQWRQLGQRAARVAAVLMLGGFLWWWAAHEHAPVTTTVVASHSPERLQRPSRLPFPNITVTSPRLPAPPQSPGEVPRPAEVLRQWLDDFYLAGIDLHDVPLSEALAQVQAEMLRLNFFGADITSRMRLAVSDEAAGRRVTFQSGAISILKAAQALAALAGCEVVVEDQLVAVDALPQAFPQRPLTQDLRSVLSGRATQDRVRDAAQIEQVRQDAIRMGILPEGAEPTKTMVAMTAGQKEALRVLAEARAQLELMPSMLYQIGTAAPGAYGPDRVLTPQEVEDIRSEREKLGIDALVELKPSQPPASPSLAGVPAIQPSLAPLGEAWQLTLTSSSETSSTNAPPNGVTNILLGSSQGAVSSSSSLGPLSTSDNLTFGSTALTTNAQLVILPVTPTTTSTQTNP